MFGQNIPQKRVHGDELQVRELFYTIQGEGPFAGMPALFIRLTGCNLKCWFCDTKWDDDNDSRRNFKFWADKARADAPASCRLAVITGGEPLRQDLGPLIQALQRHGFSDVQIETAGTYWQDCCTWPGVTVVVSPKTKKVDRRFYEMDAHWKYVIEADKISDEDGLPSEPMQRVKNGIGGGAPARPPEGAPVYLQPCDEYDATRNEANLKAMADSAMKFNYRAGLQLHKYFEVE